MRIHQLTAEEALQSLRSKREGLPEAEAQRRLLEFGPNQVERLRGTPLFFRFLGNFTHFFALILWLAAGLAFVAEHYDPGSGMATLGLAILGVVLINGLFSFWQEYRAERALEALQRLLPHQVKTLRDGHVQQVLAEALVPGDIVLLDDGDDIPADCRVIEAFAARVNNANVTGESLPQARDALPSVEEELLHSRNTLLAGTNLVAGQAKALVFATGTHTEFGKIAHLTQRPRERLSPLQQEITRLSRLVALFSLGLGLAFFLVGRGLGLPFWGNFIFAIGIIVANVPEGLLPTVSLALAMGSQRMARRNALIRHLPAVETLGAATVICTDKTGTLTQNRMEVKALCLGGQVFAPGEVTERPDVKGDYQLLFEAAFLNQTLKETEAAGKKRFLGDPTEIALVEMADRLLDQPPPFQQVDEIPFDSDRKRLSTLHRRPSSPSLLSPAGKEVGGPVGGEAGLILYTKGALESVLPLCSRVRHGAAEEPLTPEWKEKFLQAQDGLAAKGFRVLAFAHRRVAENCDRTELETELILLGLAGMEDPPRPEVPEAVRQCKEAGIKVIMVTGDHPQTALAVGRQIGLITTPHPLVISGTLLRRMSHTQLQLALDGPEVLFARVDADQKMRIVVALKAKKAIVAVTGDGVNDAPALRQADIGIAMGLAGTDVAREAADMVLVDDNFASIVAAIEEGRAVFANIRKFLTYILTSNVPELVPYLAFVLFRIPLALTIIQILALDLGTDIVPALGLGAEKPEPDVMRRPPRSPKERLLNWPVLLRSYGFLGMLEAGAAMAAFFFVLFSGGWSYGQMLPADALLYRQATTACLTAIVVMQVVNVFLCRSDRESAFRRGVFHNKLILVGIAVELGLIVAINYSPIGNSLFGTAAIGAKVWLFMLPFALGMLALEEARKALVTRMGCSAAAMPTQSGKRSSGSSPAAWLPR